MTYPNTCVRATRQACSSSSSAKTGKQTVHTPCARQNKKALIGVIQICSRQFNMLAGFSSFLSWKILHQTFYTKICVQTYTNQETPKQDFFTHLVHNQNTKFHQKREQHKAGSDRTVSTSYKKKIRKSMQSNKKSLRFIPCRIVHQLVMTQNRKCSVERRKDVNSPHVCVALLLHEFLYFLLVNQIFLSIVLSRFFNDTSFLCQNAKPDVYHLFYK